jgi:hypothetical protein
MSEEMQRRIRGGKELLSLMNQYIYDPVRPEEMNERFGSAVAALTAASGGSFA